MRADRRERWLPRVACALSGGLFACAAPPVDATAALWLGMAFLGVALFRKGTAVRARRWLAEGGILGLAFGFGANLVALRFVPGVVFRFAHFPLSGLAGSLVLPALSAFEGLRWAAAGVVSRIARRSGAPRALSLAIGVYLGTFVRTVFPWTAAGGASGWPVMIQLAEFVGERGVALLMALCAGLLADAIMQTSRHGIRAAASPLVTGLLVTCAMVVVGRLRIAEIDRQRADAPHVRIALVQPSVGPAERWNRSNASAILRRLTLLTIEAESRGAELSIWPEAAYPYELLHRFPQSVGGYRAIVQPGVRGPVLTGLILRDGGDIYNSALVAEADGRLHEPQDKRHLLWFGESIPFADRIPWIRSVFPKPLGIEAGRNVALARSGSVEAAVLNCVEDLLPDAAREMTTPVYPNLLVNVTNDAWFADGRPSRDGAIQNTESELHLRLSALRAVELRRDLVRAVNLGVTSWVDASGRIVSRYDGALPGVLVAEPALMTGSPTFYARFGDSPLLLILLLGWIAFKVRGRLSRSSVRLASRC